jgi:hypothetical protein
MISCQAAKPIVFRQIEAGNTVRPHGHDDGQDKTRCDAPIARLHRPWQFYVRSLAYHPPQKSSEHILSERTLSKPDWQCSARSRVDAIRFPHARRLSLGGQCTECSSASCRRCNHSAVITPDTCPEWSISDSTRHRGARRGATSRNEHAERMGIAKGSRSRCDEGLVLARRPSRGG